MKRVESACICQNLHFLLKEDGSVKIEIKKQYSTSPVGDYLN